MAATVASQHFESMHAVYRQGGLESASPPKVVYAHQRCVYSGCSQLMQAIDFRVEAYGPAVRDPLVRAWWSNIGFAGQCPTCGGWVHFTVQNKRALTADEASVRPKLPHDWHRNATIL